MKKILVIGAGLSTFSLIKYLLENADQNDWQVTVGDLMKESAEKVVNNHPRGKAIKFDIFDAEQAEEEIKNCDIVVSMLPARFHYLSANLCLRHNKNFVTASYVSPELKKMAAEAKEKGLIFLNEVGLDPGIDHMSTMRVLEKLKKENSKIEAFRSYTGGLVAPKYDNNPWNYKFTWNPRNVVLAGQGVAQFIEDGRYKYVPYHKLFERTIRLNVLNYGEFEGYPNRDSLQYRNLYGIDNIPTIIRGTLRRTGYSKAWNCLVQLGMTDDTYTIENSENLTYRQFTNSYLPYDTEKTIEQKVADYLNITQDSYTMYQLRWLGLFNDNKVVGLKNVTPAKILQKLLEEKWNLDAEDKDMIVMQHIFNYTDKNDKKHLLKSSLVVEGKENETSMAITVGTPVAIAVKLILQGKITTTGVHIPILPEIYEPILNELEQKGIKFIEEDFVIE